MSKKPRKYNILILTNVRWWNATAFYAVNIGRILKENGHQVTIGCRKKYPAFSQAASHGLHAVSLGFDGLNIPSLLRNFLKLLRFIREHDIQLINTHRSEDHTFALLAKLLTGVKVVITRGDRRPISRNPLSFFKYRWCDAVILTCRSIQEKNRHIFETINKNVQVIYGSVNEKLLKPARDKKSTLEKYGIDTGKQIVGIAGRLSPVKGHATFIKAAAKVLKQVKDVYFIIAGKEVEIKRSDIVHMLDELEIEDHFILLPQIDDITEVMNLFDIGVITSIGSETISRVLLEYMFLHKPVIGTRINAINEIIQPGGNGALVMPEDSTTLSNEIKKLLADKPLMKAYGENSFRLYRQHYSEQRFYEKTIQVFQKVFSLEQ
jgi:glycosyltransferase involved in cell wall biosynthesis